MLLYPRSKDRPFHLGPFPMETLPADPGVAERETRREPRPAREAAGDGRLAAAARHYRDIFAKFVDGTPAPEQAPVPNDLQRRSIDIKGAAYFLDAAQAGICEIPASAWLEAETPGHRTAIVLLVERPRLPEPDNPARGWIAPATETIADMRAAEIAVCIAGHIRSMGFSARAHIAGNSLLDRDRLAVLAGSVVRDSDGTPTHPYLATHFSLAVISTDYALATDLPLASSALNPGLLRRLADWWGKDGAQSGRERARRARRATHLSRYPMEQVKRIDRPTTLIIDDEVPRVPKRAAFFQRGLHGDLGDKAKTERTRFAFKTPLSNSMVQVIRALV
jgi:hypothetical protein